MLSCSAYYSNIPIHITIACKFLSEYTQENWFKVLFLLNTYTRAYTLVVGVLNQYDSKFENATIPNTPNSTSKSKRM